ncbi:MAG: phosphate signaling complex protein PhoU [Methanobacteriaceae archaeon]
MDENYPRISFRNKIEDVIEELDDVGQLVLDLNRKAIGLLENYNGSISEEIIAKGNELDDITFGLERDCIRFLATEQPVAGDLRFIESALRVNNHLKRIGHLAANIAEFAELIKDIDAPAKLVDNLQHMGDFTQMMLSKGFHSFLDQNIDLAKDLSTDDDKVDDLFDTILKQSTDAMFEDKESISTIINFIFIARFLERIADRAVSIGNRTIFMLTFKKP